MIKRTDKEKKLVEKAFKYLPGGSLGNVVMEKEEAFLIARGKGSRVWDVSGNEYIDYMLGSGPQFLGHAHPEVVAAVKEALDTGLTFFHTSEASVKIAEEIVDAVPCAEQVRFTTSGSDADFQALRIARAFRKRDRVLKFEGGYHGHADAVLAAAGSGVATLGIPGTAGVPRGAVADTIVVPYNDLELTEAVFAQYAGEIAALLVEPVAANMGMVLPQPGFLQGLRELTDRHGSVLIFDEVITGFRVALGGAQAHFGVLPDLSCFGKVIGGGLPVGAYGGRRSLMQRVAPEGEIFQAGTLSGNPLATAAGLAVLDLLAHEDVYPALERSSRELVDGLLGLAAEAGVPLTAHALGGLFGFFFHPGPVRNYADATKADARRYKAFFHGMLEQGVYLAPSPYEASFVTTAHGPDEVAETLEAARRALGKAV